ncbi:ATP-dependent Clp protease ATP-binding subunit [bacterium]|nr:ATP-dependent Clp protease ATP-binding subunit [bacterium]
MSNVITAYHDKIQDKSQLYDNHAIIVDQQYEPFLITQFDLFFLPLHELTEQLKNYKSVTAFKRIKRTAAMILLFLALPFAGFYLTHTLGLLSFEVPDIAIIILKEVIFFAALALLVLWHDLATNYDSQKQLAIYPDLDDFLKHSLETQGIQFQQYLVQQPLDYFHPVTFDLLVKSLQTNKSNTYIDTSSLLKTILSHEHIQRVLARLEIPEIQKLLTSASLTQETAPLYEYTALQSFILYATEQAILTKSRRVYPEHLLLALFTIFPILKDVLQEYKVDFLTFVKTIEWYIITEQYQARTNLLDTSQPYYAKGGIADGWVKGFTFYLDKISTNILEVVNSKGGIYGVGHTKEVNNLIGVLQKEFSANAVLVGDPGVGKSSIIYGLAQRILEGDIPPTLRSLTINEINLNKFLSLASSSYGGLPELINKLSEELRKQVGTILYFDDLEVLLSTGAGEGTAMSYLMPLLLQSPVPIIGTMTFAQYTTLRDKYPTVIDNFKEIRVDELSQEDTFTILTTKIDQLEKLHRISISLPALRDIITLTATYQPNKRFPKKAVELLEQAAVEATNTKPRQLTRELVAQVVAKLSDIPVAHTSPEEAERLLTLEKRIHQKYVNQHDAVLTIVDALQRAKTSVRNTTKPFGVFLFLGPSGVGKTELAKITATEYFGSEFSLIRIDLSQYKLDSDIPTIITMLRKVSLRPYTLLLLDEFEKTTTSIHDIFMRLFDEGIVVTPQDETLYFNNAIIIATSNIGSDLLLKADPAQFENSKAQVLDLLPSVLKIELINRFDKVVVFGALSLEHLQQIAVLMVNDLIQKLADQGIHSTYTDKTIAYLVSQGYVPGMGARPLRRTLQNTLETSLAQFILQTQKATGKNPKEVDFDTLLPTV